MPALSVIQPLSPSGMTVNTVSVSGQTPTFGVGNTVLYFSPEYPTGMSPLPTLNGNGTVVSFDLYVHYSDFTTTTQDSAIYHVTGTLIGQYDGTTTLAASNVTLVVSTGSLIGNEPGVIVTTGNVGQYRLTASSNISISNFFVSIMGHEYAFTTAKP
jgi:hypothetical protein